MTTTNATTICTAGARLRILYRDHAGGITERCIQIERIFTHEQTGNRLVVAYCYRREARRVFDLRRILWAMADDSTALSTFGMADAVTRQDITGFQRAIARMRAA